jgi:heme oxygenase
MNQLQQRLKAETLNKHKEAENHPLMAGFIAGKFEEKQLLQFLVNIKPCYSVVEDRLLYSQRVKNEELRRSSLISKDISLLTRRIQESDYELLKPLKITEDWMSRAWTKPVALLKADLYTRWLADFYGGKILSIKLAPFNQMYFSSNPQKVISDVRSMLDITNDNITDDEFINEVNMCFDYHVSLFEQIINGNS